MSRGSLSRICRTPKVLMPKYSDVGALAPFSLCGDSERPSRAVISWMTALRGDREDAGIAGGPRWKVGRLERQNSRILNVAGFVQKMQNWNDVLQFSGRKS